MDLIQSRHFLSLAQTLNFTRATEVCNVTQSAPTKSIGVPAAGEPKMQFSCRLLAPPPRRSHFGCIRARAPSEGVRETSQGGARWQCRIEQARIQPEPGGNAQAAPDTAEPVEGG